MKLNKIALSVGAALLAASSMAQAELSANIGATSNYVWRGVTQTADGAAISGGIDYGHESGFYAGTWASNISGGEEVDFYAGFGGEVSSFGYDVGVIYYYYPSAAAPGADFTELYGSVSFGPVTAGVASTIDSESGAADGDLYYYLSASTEISDGWSIGGTVGQYDFDAGGDYTHAQLDITKSAGDFGDFTLSASVLSNNGTTNDDEPMVFASWSKSF